jgi:hypothetical protein
MRFAVKNWQLSQLFLSDTGVHEVELETKSLKLRCNCLGFKNRSSCKHIRFVRERMDLNGGVYATHVSTKAPAIEANLAMHSPEAFRNLLINYGKIEVV